jgi:transposase-like protein
MNKQRGMNASKAFFLSVLEVVATDEEASYPRAISEELDEMVLHRTNQYLNNLIVVSNNDIDQ